MQATSKAPHRWRRSCSAEPAQCGLLRALVFYRRGDIAHADSAFTAAAESMPADKRCEWNDVRLLLDDNARRQYERMSCAERPAFEATFWWLSNPMWSEPGNERRVEHFSRKVVVGLISTFDDDGRQHFSASGGGESVTESLIRYGWPSQMIWGGNSVDASHSGWLRSHFAEAAPPYVVREYSRTARLHAVPQRHALEHPMEATREDWQLNAPADDNNWWPQEHYGRDAGAVLDLSAGQTVMLRRGDSTRFVWAGALDSTARGAAADTGRRATLVESRAVGNVRSVASFPLRGGTAAVVDAPLASGTTLVGIEVAGDSTHAAARSRFAVDVAAPLQALGKSHALSQALLFDPPSDAVKAVGAEQAVARMLTSTTLSGSPRIGVYWESYGFSPADSVDLSLRVVRDEHSNVFFRALHVLRIGHETIDSVTVKWREQPGNSRAIQLMAGETNVQERSVILDTSALQRGRYRLTLAVNKPGELATTSERLFVLP